MIFPNFFKNTSRYIQEYQEQHISVRVVFLQVSCLGVIFLAQHSSAVIRIRNSSVVSIFQIRLHDTSSKHV